MSSNELHAVRMVIQQISLDPIYRIMVYGGSMRTKQVDYESEQRLLEALKAALPDFDASNLSLGVRATGEGSVVFSGKIELDDRQLNLLGLM